MDFSERYGPWALVTGAAKGLGAAFAEALVDRGLAVLALDVDEAALRARVDALRARGGQVEPVALDLVREDLLSRLEPHLRDKELGLLVNNAGLVQCGPFFERSVEELRRAQRVNCDAPLMLTHQLGPRMRERGRGGIILVSSLSMLGGIPLLSHYAATKAFDAVLAEGLYEELRGSGVDVTTVLGPRMDTPGLRGTQPEDGPLKMVEPRRVADAALEGLGRRGRVIVGTEGHLLTKLIFRCLPHERARGVVARGLRRMYPERSS